MKLLSPRSAARRLLLAALLLSIVSSLPASATLTAPALVIHKVEIDYTKEDGTLVRVDGVFPLAALIDQPYPLQLFVNHKETFLCFSVLWGPMGGEIKELEKLEGGLNDSIVELIGIVAVPDPEAEIMNVGHRRIEVLLPPDFPTGKSQAQLFVMYRGAPLYSNPVEFEIKKESW